MERVFLGTEARERGVLTRHQLSARCTRVFPDVYAPRGVRLSLEDRIAAAWLWSRRRAVVTGRAAARLHGAKWVDDDIPIELNLPNNKAPRGVIARNETLLDDEVHDMRGMPVTTPARTAFDLGRRGPVGEAIANLDALLNATRLKPGEITAVARRHPGVPGLRRLEAALERVDPGAQSPKETWLRLLLVDAGFPKPHTQIPIPGPNLHGRPRYSLDIGWPEVKVAVEYDGEQHRKDRPQYTRDILRSEYISAKGWIVVRVVAEHRRPEIIARVRTAWTLAGHPIQTSDRQSGGHHRPAV